MVVRDRDGPALRRGGASTLAGVADHGDVLQLVALTGGQQRPTARTGVLAVKDGFKMQVTPGGPPGGSHLGDDLPHLHGLPRPDGNGLEVVVRGDQPVSVVNFHAVPAAPRMPACRPDHAGVGGIDPGAAARSKILAQVEISGRTGDRADAEPKGRTRGKHLQGRHQEALRRALQPGRGHIQRSTLTLGHRPDNGAAERDKGPAVCQDRGGQAWAPHLAGAGRRQCCALLDWRGSRKPDSKKCRGSDRTRGQCAHSNYAEAYGLFVPVGSPMSSQY